MLGTVVNTLAVLAGASIGLFAGKRIPDRVVRFLPEVIGLFTISLGLSMALKSERVVSLLFSLILGAATGGALGIHDGIERVAGRYSRGNGRFVEGFMAAFLTFCVGPMTLVGSLRDGMGDPSIILAKSVMDGVVSVALASSLGVGVLFSAPALFLFQGSLALVGWLAGQVLPEFAVREVTAAGGVLLLGVGLNLLDLKKIKVADGLPALLYAAVLPLLLTF